MNADLQTPPADVAAALAPHADKLRPGALGQLATLWQPDFANLSPAIVADLVALRLQSPANAHFLAPAAAAPPETAMNGGRAMRTGGTDALRQQIAAMRAGRGPGLSGMGA